jgi:outer membrane protein OmpA-like peptidoglycan-associated protein
MEMIRGRSLSEVRRYDLWKLLIAALLFVNALFICGKPAPQAEATKVEAPKPAVAEPPKGVVAPVVATPVAAASLAAGYAWAGDKLVLTGTVKDEAARKAMVDEALRVMGSADKVVDQLKIDSTAPMLSWQAKLAEVMGWGKAKGDGAIKVDDKLVVLTGKVASEAEKKTRADAAAALFGAEYRIDNQLMLDAPAPVALPKPPSAKLYFANNKTDVPADVSKTLSDVIAWAKAAPSNKLAVSGYHSASGSLERNHELAKGRANEVAAVLKHAGVSDAQIEMRKPVEELGGADPAQARRVEVGPAQ